MSSKHIPILVDEISKTLTESVLKGTPCVLLDCTLGGGGHTRAFLDALEGSSVQVLSLDRDSSAVERARVRFRGEIEEGRLEVRHLPFSRFEEALGSRVLGGFLADLGFSSDQIENPDRGLSFRENGPLDMRLDPSQGESCAELLKRVDETTLARILNDYGEEPFSKRIAKELVLKRGQGHCPMTTKELVSVIVDAVPPSARHGKNHIATRSFQALRIAVNQEFSELDALLDRAIIMLRKGGRGAFLSFHSLEDRRVKHRFRDLAPIQKDAPREFRVLTKKPVVPSFEETKKNPRARSAKLRIIERL